MAKPQIWHGTQKIKPHLITLSGLIPELIHVQLTHAITVGSFPSQKMVMFNLESNWIKLQLIARWVRFSKIPPSWLTMRYPSNLTTSNWCSRLTGLLTHFYNISGLFLEYHLQPLGHPINCLLYIYMCGCTKESFNTLSHNLKLKWVWTIHPTST